VRLIRALDPSDVRPRQQSGNEHPSHLIIGGHGLPSSRNPLPSAIHTAPASHGLSGAQYPSSQYDGVKVEDDYMVGRTSFCWTAHELIVCFVFLVTDAGIVP
jgi:hypothetical protein